MDVAEHHCVKQNEPDPKRTNSACCLHMWNPDCVCVYMRVCVETGGRGEGDGSACEKELKGNCVGGVGAQQEDQRAGKGSGWKSPDRNKK